ncbi:hypothetical protein JCM6882_002192 [Rhodosporidiobolus microsporus]
MDPHHHHSHRPGASRTNPSRIPFPEGGTDRFEHDLSDERAHAVREAARRDRSRRRRAQEGDPFTPGNRRDLHHSRYASRADDSSSLDLSGLHIGMDAPDDPHHSDDESSHGWGSPGSEDDAALRARMEERVRGEFHRRAQQQGLATAALFERHEPLRESHPNLPAHGPRAVRHNLFGTTPLQRGAPPARGQRPPSGRSRDPEEENRVREDEAAPPSPPLRAAPPRTNRDRNRTPDPSRPRYR